MMFKQSLFALVLAATSSLVSGHGQISSVEIEGKTYAGAIGQGSDPANSPVRPISSGDPIDDVNSPMMLCGRDSKPAPISAPVKQGDTIQIGWQAESGGGPWFHNVGPVQSYLAKCTGDCKDFTPDGSTQWFKISALGLLPGSDSKWYQSEMNNGSPLPVTIPSDLADGNYLLRHEILALQNGQTKDAAEFYPNCVQLSVSGGSNVKPNVIPSPTTTFPGAYKDTDAGILVNVYNPGLQYDMPGPAVANVATGSSGDASNGNGSSPSPSPSGSPANAAPTPSAASSSAHPTHTSSSSSGGNSTTKGSGNGKCKIKKSNNSNTKGSQKRALRAHAKRRIAQASY